MFPNPFLKKPLVPSALDRSPARFSDYEKNLVADVRKHGFFITYVRSDDETKSPSFCYTSGFWLTTGFPEIISFGLPPAACSHLYWAIFRLLKGKKIPDSDTPISGISDVYDIFLSTNGPSANVDYLLSARWFYGRDDFPSVQLVWPDQENLFPWQPGFDSQFAGQQPDLSFSKWPTLQ